MREKRYKKSEALKSVVFKWDGGWSLFKFNYVDLGQKSYSQFRFLKAKFVFMECF